MRTLVVNAGSSSVKLRVVEPDDRVGATADLGPPGDDLADRLKDFVDHAGPLDAAGHRVVHGGPSFTDSVIVDETVRRRLDGIAALAPLHDPPALAAIDALTALRPELVSVVCFDTAFHAGLPAESATYALPGEWTARWGIRRYGFHGLSCAWATAKSAQMLDWLPGRGRLVVCHLGAGASVTAVSDGRSLDTTMGFSPLGGWCFSRRSRFAIRA